MSDKPIAGLVTAAIVAPLVVVCCLGPAVLVSIFTGIAGWLGGLDPVVIAGLVLFVAAFVYGVARRRAAQRDQMPQRGEISNER